MALVKAGLKSAIQAIQNANPPNVNAAAQQWANAVFSYSSAAMAGVTIPTLVMPDLQSKFAASMNAQKFIDNLGADLLAWWTPAPWAGPGFTGVTLPPAAMQSAGFKTKIMDEVKKGFVKPDGSAKNPPTKFDVAGFLSDEIDKWTKTIKVTLTNTSSGATSTAPVS